ARRKRHRGHHCLFAQQGRPLRLLHGREPALVAGLECTGNAALMIGKLRGTVDAIGEAHAIVDLNGVGYEVQASARTLRVLQLGQEASVAIETHVREDAIRLYGFASEVERAWFRTLQTIQGVGAKVALGVLGTLAPQDLASAVALQNWAAI